MTVARMNDDAVGKFEEVIAERVKLLRRELLGLRAAQQIGPSSRTHEKRISGQNTPRFLRTVLLGDLVADMLRRVSRMGAS